MVQFSFKETLLFVVSELHSKLSLGKMATMSQVCSGVRDYMSWIVDNWNSQLDLSTYPGYSFPGNRVTIEPSVHMEMINQLHLKSWQGDNIGIITGQDIFIRE